MCPGNRGKPKRWQNSSCSMMICFKHSIKERVRPATSLLRSLRLLCHISYGLNHPRADKASSLRTLDLSRLHRYSELSQLLGKESSSARQMMRCDCSAIRVAGTSTWRCTDSSVSPPGELMSHRGNHLFTIAFETISLLSTGPGNGGAALAVDVYLAPAHCWSSAVDRHAALLVRAKVSWRAGHRRRLDRLEVGFSCSWPRALVATVCRRPRVAARLDVAFGSMLNLSRSCLRPAMAAAPRLHGAGPLSSRSNFNSVWLKWTPHGFQPLHKDH
mgnify:CR=1 FL=1